MEKAKKNDYLFGASVGALKDSQCNTNLLTLLHVGDM